MRSRLLALLSLAPLLSTTACAIDVAPDGMRKTPAGDGPRVVFDLQRRPLPEIPVPNDIATFADPTSRTGRRVNVSLVAPTLFEQEQRRGFVALEGWGTFSPITVAFARPEGADPREPALDLDNIAARTIGDGFDPKDDPFYVIDLTTGLPVLLETGNGLFPSSVIDRKLYWPNDPHRNEWNLLLETAEEGAGLSQAQYRPALDTDFDGVLDHPNTWNRPGASRDPALSKVDTLLTWYERETDTLMLRPVVPLEEKREYAVVLTDRLRDVKGRPVRSPFAAIHHAAQSPAAGRVAEILSDPSRKAYYGDMAGTGLDHVAFTWSFTTGPQAEDLFLLRDGLHGKGPFSYLAKDFPVDTRAFRAAGVSRELGPENETLARAQPRCKEPLKTPYIVRVDSLLPQMKQLINSFFTLEGPAADQLIESLKDIDHLVIGSFDSPYLIGDDPKHEDPFGRIELDFRTGKGRVKRDTMHFWLSVPKKRPGHTAPVPVTTWSHGTTSAGAEILVRAGYWARQGVAMMGIDMPGHGLVLTPGREALAEAILRDYCVVPWVTGVGAGRAHDLDEDGVADSGGYIWSARAFHSRDNIRQSVVDLMQATRVLRSWDGKTLSTQDYNGDGKPDLAGDFDGDGVPDVGGPQAKITTAGNSFGGVLAMIHGAVDANVSATAAISGGGGLIDVATRSTLTPDPVLQQVMGPLVVSVPATERETATACSRSQRSVRFVVNDLTTVSELEVACLSEGELAPGATVLITDVVNKEERCGRVDGEGRFRIPIPANTGDKIDIQVYEGPGTGAPPGEPGASARPARGIAMEDAVLSYKGCALRGDARPGRRVNTWEQARKRFTPVADDSRTCAAAVAAAGLGAEVGCQQFRSTFFPVGTPLVAPQAGLGLHRQSPELRRLFYLTQAAVDSGDPVTFAPFYMRRPGLDPEGNRLPPRGVTEFNTVGDPLVPSGTGYAFARASGALPFLPPDAADRTPAYADFATPRSLFAELGSRTPNDVLRDGFALEGTFRLGRTRAGASCSPNYRKSALCTSEPATEPDCGVALMDPDWLSEGKDRHDAPHGAVPLRLARSARIVAGSSSDLEKAWAPRLLGRPLATTDAGAWTGSDELVGVFTIYGEPRGYHVWTTGDPCRAFDHATHATHFLARYLATDARDLYVLSHPATHGCLADASCDFLK